MDALTNRLICKLIKAKPNEISDDSALRQYIKSRDLDMIPSGYVDLLTITTEEASEINNLISLMQKYPALKSTLSNW